MTYRLTNHNLVIKRCVNAASIRIVIRILILLIGRQTGGLTTCCEHFHLHLNNEIYSEHIPVAETTETTACTQNCTSVYLWQTVLNYHFVEEGSNIFSSLTCYNLTFNFQHFSNWHSAVLLDIGSPQPCRMHKQILTSVLICGCSILMANREAVAETGEL